MAGVVGAAVVLGVDGGSVVGGGLAVPRTVVVHAASSTAAPHAAISGRGRPSDTPSSQHRRQPRAPRRARGRNATVR